MHKRLNFLILAENLDIQITSSSKCISKIICALKVTHNVEVLYHPMYGSKFSWLKGATMTALEELAEEEETRYSLKDKIQARWTGFSFQEQLKIKLWQDGISSAIAQTQFDAIIALASGVDFYTHHALASMDIKIPILSYYHDPYPWKYYPKTYRNTSGKIIQRLKAKSLNRLIKNSKANLFPSKKLAGLFQKYYDLPVESIHVTPHLLMELDQLYPWNSDNDYFVKESDFNITHAGSLHSSRKVETLLKAFELFLDNHKENDSVYLNFIGPINDFKSIFEEFDAKRSGKVRLFGRLGYHESLRELAHSQVNVIIEADDNESPFLPGKFPDYVMANRPILYIGPEDSEVRRLLGSDHSHKVEHGQVHKLEEILENLYQEFCDKGSLKLTRLDLEDYLSPQSFERQIVQILTD